MGRSARVGIDVWPASTHAPGVGRYARELVRALSELARSEPVPPLSLFDVGPGARAFDASALGLEPLPEGWRHLRARLPRRLLGPLARMGLGAERLCGASLFHQVFPGAPPLGKVPRVLALSELGEPGSKRAARIAEDCARGAELVVFSARARELARERFGLPAERVHALPVGCDHWLRDAAPLESPPAPPLVLALGRVDMSRRSVLLLEAVAGLEARGRKLRLVVCGRPGDDATNLRSELARSPLGERARWIEEPRESELPALVAGAAVLAHLGPEELTPVTPLEACAFGAAVLAERHAAYEEALGESATWVEFGAPELGRFESLLEPLGRALDSGLDPAQRRARRRLASEFTWTRSARLTLELWTRILGRERP